MAVSIRPFMTVSPGGGPGERVDGLLFGGVLALVYKRKMVKPPPI